ncbi:hypothetical protein M0D69_21770 [Caballeronia sp. SEWSISQ10-4 2]|uniref:hypothetical protein n=1 Tax=Caballeronia sp. SEWSISQ10-4 2 TaxID=2937438 RepID=UPI002655EDDE|nr:hypothetical protein [Caballeronia sp. SEWSISQ10-4 2]MDN7180580.1 hypothetical protein [Caballeronia sp. SEWSISQ10-4 2]
MTTATALKRVTRDAAGDSVDRALGNAAGALSYAEHLEVIFEMPDAEVGRLIKQKARSFRRMIEQTDSPVAGRLTEPVVLELPQEADDAAPETVKQDDFDIASREFRRSLIKRQLLSSANLQAALSLTRQAVSAASRARRLFTVDVEGQSYFPAFFADGKVGRATLENVSRILGELPGWTKWDFFTTAKGSLGDISPLEALRKGRIEEVNRVASAFTEEASR